MQYEKAMSRTYEIQTAPAIGELVGHQLVDWQSSDSIIERFL